jgi:phosphopantothenoylcysteine decarboxylase/phosphopantothenate--cysteine ligase
MGVALAEEARRRGADVTLVAANLSVSPPHGIEVVDAPTAADVLRETLAHADADVLLMAAAVADYRPKETRPDKRSKDGESWEVELVPTQDVAKALGALRENGQVLVAFGADHGNEGLARKRRMLETKNADLVVFNDVGQPEIGFESADNEVVLVTRAGERTVARAPKGEIAAAVLDEVGVLLEERGGRGG